MKTDSAHVLLRFRLAPALVGKRVTMAGTLPKDGRRIPFSIDVAADLRPVLLPTGAGTLCITAVEHHGCRAPGCRAGRYPPLTPPAVRPATISRCIHTVITSTGRVTSSAAAASGPQATCSKLSTL